jgi:hypothetical protein
MATAKAAVEENLEQEVKLPSPDDIISIRIPRERADQEDKVVWVNERRFLIKRGVPVNVPRSVADILAKEESMLQYIFDFESRVQR